MITIFAPPVYPEHIRQGRFAATIVANTPELSEDSLAHSVMGKCSVGLVGIPDDLGVRMNNGRVGASQGPHAFRAALARYGAAAPMHESKGCPAYPRVFDIGDVLPGKSLEETHERVSGAARALLDLGLLPIAVGGGHDLTFAFVRGVAQREAAGPIEPLEGVYLDAHLDVRPEPGSGMSFRALLEQGYATRLTCLGADPFSNTREHFEYFAAKGCSVEAFPPDEWPTARRGAGQFVSLDIDVLDMAFAPGVSAMNPCGWSPERVGAYVEAAGRCAAVRCFDIMELSPAHDEGGRTARLAAWMFLKFLKGVGERQRGK